MKAGQFTDEQIVGILRQAEAGTKTIRDLCRENNITETTFYRWRNRFGGMDASETARTQELEKENARLKRLLPERDLEVDVLGVKLMSLNDLLGSKLDALYAEDSVEVEVVPEGAGQRVTIRRYYSSYLQKKVDEFNARKVHKQLTPSKNGEGAEDDAPTNGSKAIVISPEGLELIEAVQFDHALREDGVWTSELALEDKAGPKEKIKATYLLPSGPFQMKIRNIAGDEMVWDSREHAPQPA
jgi:putative transposase